MKKIFNIILTCLLIYFSFYYTNLVLNYIKSKDPIMIKIQNNKNKYEIEPQNAIIKENTIIPGIKGKYVNVSKSYSKMKKINTYLDTMLVFDYITPSISINNNLDKIIISGNKSKKNISILIEINDINLLHELLEDDNNYNLILTDNFINLNYTFLKNLKNNIVSLKNNKLNKYLYTKNLNIKPLGKTTIYPTFITSDYYFNTIKVLDNGSILAFKIQNEKNIKDLKILISGIKNLNYNLVSLDTLLEE